MLKRDIEADLRRCVLENSVTLLQGMRGAGKTALVRSLFRDFQYATLEDLDERRRAVRDPLEFFFRHQEPLIIDEVQVTPSLINAVRARTRDATSSGRFILIANGRLPLNAFDSTDETSPTVQLYPLSFRELSAAGIVMEREDALLRGFMPAAYDDAFGKSANPSDYYRSYLNSFIERDVLRMTALHDLSRFMDFLTLLAARTGRIINNSAIANEIGVSSTTIGAWLSALKDTKLIFTLPAWPYDRSPQIVKTPKVYFSDPAVAAYLLGIESVPQMMRDPLMPRLFENMVVADAFKYCRNPEKRLSFFKNSNGHAVDLIFGNENGAAHTLIEIHSGRTPDERYHADMQRFIARYGKKDAPVSMAVVYAGKDYPAFSGVSYLHFRNLHTIFGVVGV